MSLTNTSLTCFLASYALATVLEATRLVRPMPINRWAAWLAAAAGFVAQTIYLIHRSRAVDLPPLLASTHDWLLVVAWLTVPVYLLIALLQKDVPVGLFILPAALLFVVASRFVSHEANPHLDSLRWWGMAHAAFLVLGIAGVVIAAGFSVMYLIQYSRLRQRTGEADGLKLFSLERTARLNWWCVVVSVPLLSLGMATGALLTWLSQKTSQPISLWNWSFLVSGLSWLVLVALFGWLLTSRRPTGRIVAWRTLLAGGFVLATFVTLGIVNGGMHGSKNANVTHTSFSPQRDSTSRVSTLRGEGARRSDEGTPDTPVCITDREGEAPAEPQPASEFHLGERRPPASSVWVGLGAFAEWWWRRTALLPLPRRTWTITNSLAVGEGRGEGHACPRLRRPAPPHPPSAPSPRWKVFTAADARRGEKACSAVLLNIWTTTIRRMHPVSFCTARRIQIDKPRGPSAGRGSAGASPSRLAPPTSWERGSA